MTDPNGKPRANGANGDGSAPRTPTHTPPGGALTGAGTAPELEAPPAEIAELVILCVEAVLRAVGIQLDFTPETLPILDHYVGLAGESARERPELMPLLTRSCGAYFGEVLRRHIGGSWRLPPSDNIHDWAFCARPVFLWINPIGVAFDALSAGTEHDGPRSQLHVAPEHRAAVNARLDNLPEVAETDFHTFSTRFEVVEVATDALLTEQRAQGYDDIEYTLSDYEAELNALL